MKIGCFEVVKWEDGLTSFDYFDVAGSKAHDLHHYLIDYERFPNFVEAAPVV